MRHHPKLPAPVQRVLDVAPELRLSSGHRMFNANMLALTTSLMRWTAQHDDVFVGVETLAQDVNEITGQCALPVRATNKHGRRTGKRLQGGTMPNIVRKISERLGSSESPVRFQEPRTNEHGRHISPLWHTRVLFDALAARCVEQGLLREVPAGRAVDAFFHEKRSLQSRSRSDHPYMSHHTFEAYASKEPLPDNNPDRPTPPVSGEVSPRTPRLGMSPLETRVAIFPIPIVAYRTACVRSKQSSRSCCRFQTSARPSLESSLPGVRSQRFNEQSGWRPPRGLVPSRGSCHTS